MRYLAIILILACCVFAQDLKQSTAVDVVVGPLVDEADGRTVLTGSSELELSGIIAAIYKGSSRTAITLDANNFTDINDGYWQLSLDVNNTDTLGSLIITLRDDDVFLPAKQEYSILSSNLYNSLYSTDKLEVDVVLAEGSDYTTYFEGQVDHPTHGLSYIASELDNKADTTYITSRTLASSSYATASNLQTVDDNVDSISENLGYLSNIIIAHKTTLYSATSTGNISTINIEKDGWLNDYLNCYVILRNSSGYSVMGLLHSAATYSSYIKLTFRTNTGTTYGYPFFWNAFSVGDDVYFVNFANEILNVETAERLGTQSKADVQAECEDAIDVKLLATEQQLSDVNDVINTKLDAIPTKPSRPSF